MSLGDNEAGARVLINRLLESAGWRFEDSAGAIATCVARRRREGRECGREKLGVRGGQH